MKRLIVSTLLLGACAGSETGNGFNEWDVEVTMVAFNDQPVLAALDEDGVAFDIADAKASVTRIELVLPDGKPCLGPKVPKGGTVAPYAVVCQGDNRLSVDGPWVVDLITGEFTPPLGELLIPQDTYTRVEVSMAPSDALSGSSFYAAGTFVLDGETRHYDVALDFTDKARFEPDGPWKIDAAQSIELLVDVRTWFDKLPVSACVAAGEVPIAGGVYQLEATTPSCANVPAAIKKAIKEAGKAKHANKPK